MSLFSSQKSEIPQKLHFLWGMLENGTPLPDAHRSKVEGIQKELSEWQVEINDPLSINRIAPIYMGGTYTTYPRPVQRCNACRPMLMHKFGGIYSDIDIDFQKPAKQILADYPKAGIILVEEKTLSKQEAKQIGEDNPIRDGESELTQRIANYFMASIPNHPFWMDVMLLMKERSKLKIQTDYDASYTTGSDVISEVYYAAHKKYKDIIVIPKKKADKYIVHQGAGTWRTES